MRVPLVALLSTACAGADSAVTFQRDDLVQVIEGVAIGFFLKDNVKIIDPCIHGFQGVEEEFEQVAQLLLHDGAVGALKALRILSKGLNDMADTVKECGATEEQVEKVLKVLETFRNPLTFFYRAGKNLLVNGQEIYNELHAAVENWRTEQYRSFGFEVGLAMHKVVLGDDKTQDTEPESLEFSPADAVKVIEGINEGFFVGETKIEKTCVLDAEGIRHHLEAALQLFAKWNKEDAMTALIELAKAMDLVKDALKVCKAEEVHLEKLGKAIALIRDPVSFAYTIYSHILLDGVEIVREVNRSRVDWKNKEYEAFGVQIGLIFDHVLVGAEEPKVDVMLTPLDAVKIVEGVSKGFFVGKVKMEPACVQDEQALKLNVDSAFKLFTRGTAHDAMKGLEQLTYAMDKVRDALKECKAEEGHLEKLATAIALIRDPVSFAFTAYKHLVIDSVEIYGELHTAKLDWAHKSFEDFGDQLGLIFSQVLVGADAPVDVEFTPSGALELIEGFSEGFFGGKAKMEKDCVKDAQGLKKHVERMIELSQTGRKTDMALALKELVLAMKMVVTTMKACKAAKKHTKALMKALALIENLPEFAVITIKHITYNGVDIKNKLEAANDDWKHKEFEACGVQWGLILSEIVLGAGPRPDAVSSPEIDEPLIVLQ